MIEAGGVFQHGGVATGAHVPQDALHGGEDLVVGDGIPFQQRVQARLEIGIEGG